jgi:DNA-binding transcriptional MerR regulator
MGRSRILENWKRNIRRRRAKQRGTRRSRAKPTEGWTLVDFARLLNVQPRTVRHYLEVGVLSRPPFRGTATRYGRGHLLVVLAVRRLQSTENLTLDAIRRRLGALEPAELEALATEHLSPGPAATALGIQFAPPPTPSEPKPPFDAPGTARWIHIELALGLELHVRQDASQTVIALAERVKEMCKGGG